MMNVGTLLLQLLRVLAALKFKTTFNVISLKALSPPKTYLSYFFARRAEWWIRATNPISAQLLPQSCAVLNTPLQPTPSHPHPSPLNKLGVVPFRCKGLSKSFCTLSLFFHLVFVLQKRKQHLFDPLKTVFDTGGVYLKTEFEN